MSERKYLTVGEKRIRETDAWRTPHAIFKDADRVFVFTLDAAARHEDRLKFHYLGPDHMNPELRDSLAFDDWAAVSGGPVWVNPPSSQEGGGLINWIERAARTGLSVPCVALVPATPSTRWFEYAYNTAAEVYFYRTRVAFLRPDGTPSKAPRGEVCAFVWVPHVRGPARVRYVTLPTEVDDKVTPAITPAFSELDDASDTVNPF